MQTITIEQGRPWATCEKAYCIGNPFNCPCGYAEGMCGPNYSVPAIRYLAKMDMSWKGSYYIFDYSKSSIGYLVRVLETK